MTPSILVLIPLFLLNLSQHTQAEVYTALAELEDLFQTEAVLINSLETYIQTQQQKLTLLRRYAEAYQNQHDIAAADVQVYVANPLNAYLLVKRLTTDWKEVQKLIEANAGSDFMQNMTDLRGPLKFPTDEDLNGAAVALTRLQDTYKLDTASLAKGELNGVKYSTELNAADCFELGRQSYNNEDYYHTQLWMREADVRLGREVNETVGRSDILEYLAFSTFKQGNVHLALDLTNKLLELVPTHQRASGNKVYYENSLLKINGEQKKGDDGTDQVVDVTNHAPLHADPHRNLYEQLCRGEETITPELAAELKCFYYKPKNNKYLQLAPFKVEEAYKSPHILIFYDVMTDSEISLIKKMAQPRFKRATVQNSQTGELETAQYRISKSAWLKDMEHKYIATVSQRVEDMTGLSMKSAEELQVVNYGIGGHYEPHYDFARKEEINAFKSLGTGNRIATVLFYMSDVSQGGATVFPHIHVALWPKKGAAAFWFNLHADGEGDKRTRHAACPVLAGSKWVSNKWIHEREQEFRRPCDLSQAPVDQTA